ncbi:hypothetical protein [Alkalibacillus haloalkaliphilus]|uniref:hypothetical protein n=1 Tax=Alkalibacillus haloalkaliphilus TaxID=94136 RepID=UPI002936A7C8|nr:hypothetical protein [Alkalibacillus haloalkaliphilus]MDV2581956.1 hypothetical protein [Alkalibacillus haloalkaliphilus]
MNRMLKWCYILGLVLFMQTAVFSFGVEGRTGQDSLVLVYILLISLSLIQVGLIYWIRIYSEDRLIQFALLLTIVGIPFLMISQFVSLLHLVGETIPEVLSIHLELTPIGAMSLLFPFGLISFGYVLFKRYMRIGITLSISAFVMMVGLVITPWVHHVGIIAVSVFGLILVKKL